MMILVFSNDIMKAFQISRVEESVRREMEELPSRGIRPGVIHGPECTDFKFPYNRDSLIDLLDKGERFEYFPFYGHKKSTDGTISDSCFSQWYEVNFMIDGCQYLTAEQYMMSEKARLFKDDEMLQEILNCRSPREAKTLGRKVRNFEKELWDKAAFEIVVRGNLNKFRQNPELETFLLSTGSKVLVEASPRDRIWGIGLGKANPNSVDPKQWRGRNQLGFALCKVRDILAEQ